MSNSCDHYLPSTEKFHIYTKINRKIGISEETKKGEMRCNIYRIYRKKRERILYSLQDILMYLSAVKFVLTIHILHVKISG